MVIEEQVTDNPGKQQTYLGYLYIKQDNFK